MKILSLAMLLASCAFAPSAFAVGCFMPAGSPPSANISVVAPEMAITPAADPYCQSVDQVLARLRAPIPAAGAYKPLTKDDNTPWRFDMSQNGRRMTAAEFGAWMKAKGIRVATGKPAVQPAPEAPPASAAPPVETGK